MTAINIEYNDQDVLKKLQDLLQLTGNLKPALLEIGELLTESTKKRFESTTAPDGSPWALNSVLSTLIVEDGEGNLRKKGDRPLTNHGTLGQTINYQLDGSDTLLVGSPMEYAAMMQFGGTKEEFPNLWGDIPARPFIGVSDDDLAGILDILDRHLNLSL